jgi:hypothetical protein
MSDAGLKYFDSPVTKRRVALNPHPADFAWLYLPTKAEFEDVLREHERIRIQETWKEWSEQDGESRIKGFRDGPNSSLRVLAARAVAERLGSRNFGEWAMSYGSCRLMSNENCSISVCPPVTKSSRTYSAQRA